MSRDAWPSVLLLSGVLMVLGCRGWPLPGDYPDRDEVQAELDHIKQRLLANLGLSRVPDVSRANVSAAEMSRMMELYRRSVAESDEDEDEEEEDEDRSIHRFYSFRDSAPINRTSSWQHLYFPLTISKGQPQSDRRVSVYKAKLRLHKLCKGQRATVSLYQLLQPWDRTERAERVLVEERKLTRRRRPRGAPGRTRDTVFELSGPASSWLDNPELNHGLLLRCSGRVRSRHSQYTGSRPVLDVLVKERPTRQKRSRSFDLHNFSGQNVHKDCTSSNKTNLCCRYSLIVSFKEIGWDFVHRPKKFQADFCRGKCVEGKSSYNSNHAHIQSIVNYKKGKAVPKPCCAPKKLGSLNILHMDDKVPQEHVVTRLKGMKVKSCGCS